MYPYGDTRTDLPPVYDDDRDQRAARRTIRFLAVALFVAVLAGTLVLSLLALDTGNPSPGDRKQDRTVTTPPPRREVGPPPGVEVAGYVASRQGALAALRDQRVAVVSLGGYSTPAQAKALVGSLPVDALLVAPRGMGPSVVVGDLSAWVKAQTDATRVEREELKRLIPTVDDPTFKAFYTEEADRLDKALKNLVPDSAMVFGVVVRGPAPALQALSARPEVRLVDVGEAGVADPNAVYRGLRPEEQTRANDPAVRPL